MDDLTPDAVAAIATSQLAQITDPAGYARAQAITAINDQYGMLAAVADPETLVKLGTIRDAQLAALDPAPPIPDPLLTVADLGLTVAVAAATPISHAPALVQFVEPERDGQPWCTWEDAEHLLVSAAKPLLRGQSPLGATGYRLVRDDAAMTLSLVLTGS